MSWRHCLLKKLSFVTQYLVKPKWLPELPAFLSEKDTSVIFVMPTDSAADLFSLEKALSSLSDKNDAEIDKPLQVCHTNIGSKAFFEQCSELVSKQADSVIFVPVSFFWGRNPGREKSLWRLLFTDTERMHPVKKALMILVHGRRQLVQFSQPVSLAAWMEEHCALDSEARYRKLQRTFRVHFHRVRTATMGPTPRQRDDFIESVLKQGILKQAISREQSKKHLTKSQATALARSYADEMMASHSQVALRVLERLLDKLWKRLYDKIHVEGTEQLRQTARDHVVVYVPCHRSHIDYLLLSYILYNEGLVPPKIAAGINLNFFPAGPILRRTGAFFIRRTLGTNQLYTAVFQAYLNELVKSGHPVEFFPEGGRSRTGRMYPLKTGMLQMMLQASKNYPHKKLVFVPVYLSYDRVMEVPTYRAELEGAKKDSESMSQLMRVRHLLRQKFGQIQINFADPIALNNQSELPDAGEPVEQLSQSITDTLYQSGIVGLSQILCTIMLPHDSAGLKRQSLESHIDWLLQIYRALNQVDADWSPKYVIKAGIEAGIICKTKPKQETYYKLTERYQKEGFYYRNNTIDALRVARWVLRIITLSAHDNQPISHDTWQSHRNTLSEYLAWTTNVSRDAIDQQITVLFELYKAAGILITEERGIAINHDSSYQDQLAWLEDYTSIAEAYEAVLFSLSAHQSGQLSRSEFERAWLAENKKIIQQKGAAMGYFLDKSSVRQLMKTGRERGWLAVEDSKLHIRLPILEVLTKN